VSLQTAGRPSQRERRQELPTQPRIPITANDLLDKIPQWVKSLYRMENELRNAARNGLILRKEEASTHLAEARRHLKQVMNEGKGVPPTVGKLRYAKRASSEAGAMGAATAQGMVGRLCRGHCPRDRDRQA
jgi:hypothetical protein